MTADGPLNGVTILDLTRVLAGPFCTLTLADLGARVIKVEPPGGDDARQVGPFVAGRSAYFASVNRGKESIALDLKAAGDRVVFEKLIGRADVLLENFRPGTMARLGYAWEDLHGRYPALIYAAISGFGQTGPYRDRASYDMVAQAMGGVMSLTGHDGGQPTRVGTSIGDITAGLFMATAINGALYHRAAGGKGMMIDISMLDCQVAIMENAIARYFATGDVPGPLGARHPSITPFEVYATADGHIVITAGNDALFAKCCAALGRADMAQDTRFTSNERRNGNVEALKEEFERALAAHSTAHWVGALEAAGVPSGPINNIQNMLADPQIAERNMVVTSADGPRGPFSTTGNPIKLSTFPDPAEKGSVSALDEDRDQILAELD